MCVSACVCVTHVRTQHVERVWLCSSGDSRSVLCVWSFVFVGVCFIASVCIYSISVCQRVLLSMRACVRACASVLGCAVCACADSLTAVLSPSLSLC